MPSLFAIRWILALIAFVLTLEASPSLQGAPPAGLDRLRSAFSGDRFIAYTPSQYSPLAGARTNATAASIRADLSTLRPYFNVLITYSCNPDHGLDQIVPVASELGIRVVLGVWDVKSVREIATAVTQARTYADTVIGIIVGNETLLRGEKWENLEAAIQLVRAALPAMPISTSEPISSYGDEDLRQVVDFHAPICMWIFQGGKRHDPTAAVAWLNKRISALQEMPAGNKPILIKEHGLPSGPLPFTPAIQKEYWVIWRTTHANTENCASSVFEFADLPWKPKTNPSELGATEAFWGAWTHERQPKQVLEVFSSVDTK